MQINIRLENDLPYPNLVSNLVKSKVNINRVYQRIT